MVSLRWLALFRDFNQARDVNWGHTCLAHLYSVMDTLSRGTLRQLARPWKLLKVSLFSFSHVVSQIVLHTLANCICFTCHISLQIAFHALANCFLLSHKLSSCKPYPFLFLANYHLANCYHALFLQTIILQTVSVLFLANYHLVNYICALSCKLYLCSLSLAVIGLVLWPCLPLCGCGPEGLPFNLGSSQQPYL